MKRLPVPATSLRPAGANPAVTQFQRDLAIIHRGVGATLLDMGKPEEALSTYTRWARSSSDWPTPTPP